MRAFFGIPLDQEWTRALGRVAHLSRATGDTQLSRARWVPPENLHLTLRFLGEIDDPAAERLVADVRLACTETEAFNLPIEEAVRAIPSASRASMLWSTFSDPHGTCSDLVRRLSDTIASHGFAPESRPFAPHVTLARLRGAARIDEVLLSSLDDDVRAALGGGVPSVSVRTITLFSSTLSRSGATYSTVAEIDLPSR